MSKAIRETRCAGFRFWAPNNHVTGMVVNELTIGRDLQFTTEYFDANFSAVWAEQLKELKTLRNARYLEIGAYEGRSLIWTLLNLFPDRTGSADVIDPFFEPGTRERFWSNVFDSRLCSRVAVFDELSADVLPRLHQNTYDLIYIDGNHSYSAVLFDALNSWPLLKVGGYMVFDDYKWGKWSMPSADRPEEAIDNFLRLVHKASKVCYKDWQVFLQKKEASEVDKAFWQEPGQKMFSNVVLPSTILRAMNFDWKKYPKNVFLNLGGRQK